MPVDGRKSVLRILGVNPRLDRVPVELDLCLGERQLFARGDLELPGDEIETRDLLRHRMFDLEPRIHFDEPETVRPQSLGAIGNELNGAGAAIADGSCRLDRGGAHLRPQLRRHARRGRFLDDLLMAALQRAIALAEMDDVAMPVGENLDFDVTGRSDIFLDQDATGAERRRHLPDRAFEGIFEVGLLVDTAQPAAAAAGGRLDQHRITDRVGLLLEKLGVLTFAVIAGHNRDAGLFHERLGAILEPHGADCSGGRTDEDKAGLLTGFGEFRAFGQEPVAGMNAFGASLPCNLDQPFDREIAFARFRGPDEVGLVAEPPMQGARIRGRIDTDRAQAETFGSAGDAAGDFAAIGDEHGFEHDGSFLPLAHTDPPGGRPEPNVQLIASARLYRHLCWMEGKPD